MYVNDRDQINYHGFLKVLREMQGANLKQVAEGICSDSEISRMEMGDRLPEKLMRDRVTSRLGVSGEEYEEYLRPEEYRQWEICMYILDCINKGDVEGAEKGVEEFDKIADQNPVQEQFADTMRYMLAQMKGASTDLLRALIELAIVHTVPDIDAAFAGVQLLADQELNLIMEYTHLREYYGEEDEFEWRLSQYKRILAYVDQSYMDIIGKSKIYPRVAQYVCDWVLKENPSLNNLEYAFELCNKSIEFLRDASRLYYFVELLEYRKEIIVRMCEIGLDKVRTDELQVIFEKDTECETLFKKLYMESDVPIYMQNFTYLYVETECNSAVEVIRTRRHMMKMSRLKVSDNICTEKTVERFENYTHSPSIVIIRDIFERIGLCAEYRRARVITDNAELLRLSNEIIKYINDYDVEKIEVCLNELSDKLHLEISFNKQEVKRYENKLLLFKDEIDVDEFNKRNLEALQCTVPLDAILRPGKKYFTRSELTCMYSLAFSASGSVPDKCLSIIEDMCMEMLEKEIDANRIIVIELLMSKLASRYGSEERYDISNRLSEKLLKECLRHRRMETISDNIYNNLWNYQQQNTREEWDSSRVLEKLNKCIVLSQLVRKDNWTKFFQQKVNELNL